MQFWELEGIIIKEVGSNKAMSIMTAIQTYIGSQNNELFRALRITSAMLQGQDDKKYKIEGTVYRVGDVLDNNNELLGKIIKPIG